MSRARTKGGAGDEPAGPVRPVERVPLEDLRADPNNARVHDERNLEAIRASLERFGQVEPLVARADGTLIGGNGRLSVMSALGWTEANVVRVDVSDAEATALGIALNRTAELAGWDDGVLVRLLRDLGTDDLTEVVGFSAQEIDELVADAERREKGDQPDAGAQELPDEPISRAGDLWSLGDHRLLCGDSTNVEHMARLMGDDRAVLLATDPPYLVDYQGGNHPQSWANKPDVKDKHWDDYSDPDASSSFFSDLLRVALAHCTETVPVYQWHATRRQVLVEQAWIANDLLVHQTIIWVKARPVLTRCHFMWQHEPCFYGWRTGKQPEKDRKPPANERTVWEIDQVGQQDGIHPTQRPLALFARPIEWHSRAGEVVLEPFSGSGTQLVAAEQLGRRCRAMEISPAFVDAAIRRWELTTGKRATLDGKNLDQLALERAAKPKKKKRS